MKKLITILVVLISISTIAQSKYEKGMQEAFQLWGQNKPTEAINLFERISSAETANWLPSYYAAQVNITRSFGERDKEKLTAQLNKAQESLDTATAISKNNPEIMVMQALLHTAWVAYDGATYGMTLSGKVVQLYSKALAIAPNNPRVVYSKARWDIGGAQFFGQDTAPFCKDIEKSIELFATFEPKTPFHPNWGKDQAEGALADCK